MSSIIKKLNRNCVSCNVFLNEKNMVKNREKCYKCLNKMRKKSKKPNIKHVYENNTMIKTERTLIDGRSGCGKTFLMLSLLKDKNPDYVHIICKTDNQYLSKYYDQSSEILPLENYGNKTIVFDGMLGSKEAKDFDAFFTRGRHQKLDIYYISQSWYELPKNTIRNNCSRHMLFPQMLKVITMIYNDISGLNMIFSEWRDLYRDAWKKRYNYVQIDKDKDLDDMYSNKNVSGLEITAIPGTDSF